MPGVDRGVDLQAFQHAVARVRRAASNEETREAIRMLADLAQHAFWPGVLLLFKPGGPSAWELAPDWRLTDAVSGIFYLRFDEAIKERDGTYPWWTLLYIDEDAEGEPPRIDPELRAGLIDDVILSAGYCPPDQRLPFHTGPLGRRFYFAALDNPLYDLFVEAMRALLATHLPPELMRRIVAERTGQGRALPSASTGSSAGSDTPDGRHGGESAFLLDRNDPLARGRGGAGRARSVRRARSLAAPETPSAPTDNDRAPIAESARATLFQRRDAARADVRAQEDELLGRCAAVAPTELMDLAGVEAYAAQLVALHQAGERSTVSEEEAAPIRALVAIELPLARQRAQALVEAAQVVCAHEFEPGVGGKPARCRLCFLERTLQVAQAARMAQITPALGTPALDPPVDA